jgi:hypothetical protein
MLFSLAAGRIHWPDWEENLINSYDTKCFVILCSTVCCDILQCDLKAKLGLIGTQCDRQMAAAQMTTAVNKLISLTL